MREIIVGNWQDALSFRVPVPYAVISFISTRHHKRAPKLKQPLEFKGRIIIEADDVMPAHLDAQGMPVDAETHADTPRLSLFSSAQAKRVVSFIDKMAPQIDTLFVHCVFGEGRSAAAAIAIAKAYKLPWEQYNRAPYAPNPWIIQLLDKAFADARCGEPPLGSL